MNQSLTHNIRSHGRFRGTLKNLEKLMTLQALRHIYGTVAFCRNDFVIIWMVIITLRLSAVTALLLYGW